MSLSCSCDFGDSEWWYMPPTDYSTLDTSKRKRCCSCNQLIDVGAVSVKFPRERPALTDIEERIYGDEVPLADYHMCEECGDLFFSLEALGFCISIGAESMKSMLAEYHSMVREGYL